MSVVAFKYVDDDLVQYFAANIMSRVKISGQGIFLVEDEKYPR